MRATTSRLISSGGSVSPTTSCMYTDHSGELIPIMSAWAVSLQRPPRSRARPSRTSSQSSSVSKMTPSRSKTTASTAVMSVYTDITSNREVAAEAVDEAGTDDAELGFAHFADEDGVVAGGVFGPGGAVEPRDGSLDAGAEIAVADVDTAPESDRRGAA